MDGVGGEQVFIDSSANGFTITSGNNVYTDTTEKKFGSASARFDGNGDYLWKSDDADLDFGTGDFTIDFWVRLNSIQQSGTETIARNTMVGKNGYTSAGGWVINYGGASGDATDKIRFYTETTKILISDASALTTNQWYHIAVSRSGTTAYLFIDGVLVDTGACSTNFNNAGGIYVGEDANYVASDRDLDGRIDELRITKDYARWTDSFVVPSSAYGKGGLYFMYPDGTEVSLA